MLSDRYYGWVDVMHGTWLVGWAVDQLSASPCPIDVYVNSVRSAQGLANRFRPDLPVAIANSGFAIDLVGRYHQGDRIEAYIGETSIRLPAVPEMARGAGRRILDMEDFCLAANSPFIPVPPAIMANYIGHSPHDEILEHYKVIGALIAVDVFNILSNVGCDLTAEGFHLVDLGCGCGRIASFLAPLLRKGRYTGYDVWADGVMWAIENLSSKASNLLFRCLTNGSGYEGQRWFPVPEEAGSVDCVMATSLFTHLNEAAGAAYISEIGRVLRPGAPAYLTFFLRDEESVPIFKSMHNAVDWEFVEEPGVSSFGNGGYLNSCFDLEFVEDCLGRVDMEVVSIRRGNFREGRYKTINQAAYQDLLVTRMR
jgi:SAM-dependent methyltransferase